MCCRENSFRAFVSMLTILAPVAAQGRWGLDEVAWRDAASQSLAFMRALISAPTTRIRCLLDEMYGKS